MKVSSPKSNRAPRFYLHLFGSLVIRRTDEPVHLPTRKIQVLLAYLVLHPEPHAREKLAALFWGDASDEQARVSLRYALGQLRKTLGSELLLADRETVQLNPDFPIWVDAKEFKDEIRGMRAEEKLILQPSSLTLYSGDLLADFYDDWIFPEREHFRQLYLDALLQLTQQFRAQSEYAEAIETAQRVLESDPANERAHQHLMFCFVAQGNRHAALQQYEQCVRALFEELAVDPAPETTALYEWIRKTPGESFSPAARITNLPIPFTSFIGRGQEMAQVKAALTPNLSSTGTGEQVRLLTLIGAGGSGKTRLAIQAATDLIDAYEDGVWWVELAALADGALVPRAVANALGVRESPQQPLLESLTNFLREKQLLLALDNCEHLLDACVQLARALLGACANLYILATSRESLGFIGETALGISTLAFPDPNAWSLTELLMQYDAVRLFVARATAVNSRFELTTQNASAVAQICAQLDGIPLALELAAARVKEFSAEEIAARLEDRFNFLTRGNRGVLPRHQTLRTLFDWSYDLLSESERVVLRRLSVLAGGWTLEAVEFVCADEDAGVEVGLRLAPTDILDLVTRLVDKSLIIFDEQAEGARYRILETIRQYAREKLAESGEGETVRNRHMGYFFTLVNESASLLRSGQWVFWLRRLEQEQDNVRAAMAWAFEMNRLEVVQVTGALYWSWYSIGFMNEGRGWSEQALALSDRLSKDQSAQLGQSLLRARASVLHGAAMQAFGLGDNIRANALLEASIAQSRQLDDKRGLAEALTHLGVLRMYQGDHRAALRWHRESVQILRQTDAKWSLAYALIFMGDAVAIEDRTEARKLYEESLALFRGTGDKWGITLPLISLGHLDVEKGDYAAARTLLEEGLTLRREVGDHFMLPISLNALAEVLRYQGELAAGTLLSEESLKLNRAYGQKSGVSWSLCILGNLARTQGDYKRAGMLFREALSLSYELGQKREIGNVLEALAQIAAAQESSTRAVRLFGAADGLRQVIGVDTVNPTERAEHDNQMVSLRAKLGAQRFSKAWTEGRALTLEQAIELALSD